MPWTQRQRAVAIVIVAVLSCVAAVVMPYANVQLGRIDNFVPVLQTVLSLADLLTAILLFAQYSIQRQRALLAVASGYVLASSFAFLQTLSFPGAYAPNGIIGDGFNTPAWFFVLWHGSFQLSILAYALLKDRGRTSARSAASSVTIALACAFCVIAALSWLVTVEVEYLPRFYIASITLQTSLGNQANVALLCLGSLVLVALLVRARTVLDLWLMVTLFASLPNFLVAALASSVRFSLGWYAARGFTLVASCMLLAVLLTEMTVLYSRLASALTMQRREGANRLASIDAATAAIAHEIASPLGSITLNAGTGLHLLSAQPPRLGPMTDILKEIEELSLKAGDIIASVRSLFKDVVDRPMPVSVENSVRQVLRLLQHELQFNEVSVATEFQAEARSVHADPTQLQQVILNLIKNAIDAMGAMPPDSRRLSIGVRAEGTASVLLSVQDTGGGVLPEDQGRIFEAFFTTKPAGMGLGLAICSMIVERSGGRLVLASSSSQGSIFELVLPAVATDGIAR